MSAGRGIAALALFAVVAVAPVLPAFLAIGALPDGHDSGIHVVNAVAYADALAAGIVVAHDVPSFRAGYGGPNFKFYPPYAYLPAALAIRAGQPPAVGLGLSIALAAWIGAVGAARFARGSFGPGAALLCGVAYALAPYRLAEIFPRGAHAELWGAALLPWILVALDRCRDGRPGGCVALAIAVALQGLVHPLSALLTAPVAAAWCLLGGSVDRRVLLRVGAGVALGAALGAFYWLPALGDRGSIAMAVQFDDRAAYVAHALHGAELWRGAPVPDWKPGIDLRFAGLVLAAAILACLGGSAPRRRRVAAAVCAVGTVVATTPMAARVCVSIPGLDALRYLQFPWRFLLAWSLFGAWWIAAAADGPRRTAVRTAALTIALAWIATGALPFAYGSTLPPAAGPVDTVPSAAHIRTLLAAVPWTGDVEDKYRLRTQTAAPDQPAGSVRLRAGTGDAVLDEASPERFVVRRVGGDGPWTATIGRFASGGWEAEPSGGRVTVDATPATALLRVTARDTDVVTLRYVGGRAYRIGVGVSLVGLVVLVVAAGVAFRGRSASGD